MRTRPPLRSLRAALALGALLAAASPGSALALTPTTPLVTYDGDGTLDVNFYPALNAAGTAPLNAPAPTVIIASPWAGKQLAADTGDTIEKFAIGDQKFIGPQLGPASLRKDGYNVVTYDARGWWNSTGHVWLDNPTKEGKDPSRIIDWLVSSDPRLSVNGTRLVKLQSANDPLIGMTGVSYGGAVQLEAAANDARIDVIEPAAPIISPADSLAPNGVVKQGLGNVLCASGVLLGANLSSPAQQLCSEVNTGVISQSSLDYGATVGAGASSYPASFKTPTLLMAGTIDTMFPLGPVVGLYQRLKATAAPVKMVWGCGGHGLCEDSKEPMYSVVCAQHAWLDTYLGMPTTNRPNWTATTIDGETGAPHQCLKAPGSTTSPPASITATNFVYADQTNTILQRPTYEAPTGSITASGHGSLDLNPWDTSGFVVGADVASNAFEVTIPAPSSAVELQAAPTLTITYRGWDGDGKSAIFAQLIDNARTRAIDNQSTPIPVILDGWTHTTTVKLAVPLWKLEPGKPITLQLTDYSNMFYDDDPVGHITSLDATITVPTNALGTVPN